MKIADLVTEMRMNKMTLLLNIIKKKEEFEYFWQVHLSLNSQTIRSSQIARITEWLKQF